MIKKGLLRKIFYFSLALPIIASVFIFHLTQAAIASTPIPKPQYGGVLKIIEQPGLLNLGYPGETGSFNDGFLARPCVESLLSLDEKGTDVVIPQLATGWKISPDYKSITFTLRKDVKFHDGTDFNAEAAKYCLDLYRLGPKPELKSVTSIDIIDHYTIRLNLSTFNPSLLISMVGPASWMVSPNALKKMSKEEAMTHPVGTGPFKFVSYQRDVFLKFEKFTSYWQKGKPYLDGVEFHFIADPVTSLISFKTGEAQAINRLGPKDVSDLKAMGKYNIATGWSAAFGLVGDSAHTNSPFANIKVRQAIAYAIDNEAIANAIGYGLLPSASQFAPPGGYAFNPAVVGYPYNPQKAKQLLAEAGYPNGFQTKLTFTASATNRDLFTAVQGYLVAVGINAQLDAADRGRFAQMITGGWSNQLVRFDIPCSKGMDPATALMTRLSSKASTFDTKSLYISPDYDAKLFLAATELDPQKRQSQFQELSKMIIDQYCMAIPLYIGASLMVKSPTLHNLDIYQYSLQEYHPENAWLSK